MGVLLGRRRGVLGAGAAAIALLLAVAPAQADDVAEARRLFARGERDYAAGRFETALSSYSRAHELSGLAGFLFNIGVCHHRLEHWAEAADFLERYLEAVPDAPNRGDAEELLREARLHLPPPAPPPAPSPAPVAPPPPEEPSPPPPPASSGFSLGRIRAPAWIALGSSFVLGAVAVAFSLDLQAAQSELDDESLDCTLETVRCHALRDRGERAALLQVVLGGAGIAALVAGGVLATLDLTRADDPGAVQLSLGPASLSLGGTW